jgi:signal transduction histidine kinase
VERLDRVVQELLDFAKPVTPARKPSDANEIVQEALALVSDDASFRRIELVSTLPDGLPAVLVDPLQIRQALLNVLLNGFEAMPEGGRLTVETRGGLRDGADSFVTVTVTDTGEGMNEDEVGKLYEPFYTTKQHGTGLGLTIVARVLGQNGGSISASSVPGTGSSFVLRLPIAGGEVASGPTPSEGAA